MQKLFSLREATCNMPRHLAARCYSVGDSQVSAYEIRRHDLNHGTLVPDKALNLHLCDELIICTFVRLFAVINVISKVV